MIGSGSARAYLLLTITAFCWGANTILAKLAVDEVSPMVMVFLRWIVVVVLLSLSARALARDWNKLKPALGFLFLMGALGFAAFNGLFFVAAHHTSALNMGIISGTMPVFVLFGMVAVYRTPVSSMQVAGVGATLLGVVVIACGGDVARLLAFDFNMGDLLILTACTLYAGYTVGLRRRPEVSAEALFMVLAVSAVLASIPLVAIEAGVGQFVWPTAKGWLVVCLVALFPTLLAQLLFIKGVEIIGPGRAGVFVNLVPVFAALLAVSFLGERFELYHGVALALVLGGIWMSERGSPAAQQSTAG